MENNIQILHQVSANKKMQTLDALSLAGEVDELYSIKGKKVSYLHLDKPNKDSVLKLMLGPTGNLRAPTLRFQKTLVVGYSRDIYAKLIFSKRSG